MTKLQAVFLTLAVLSLPLSAWSQDSLSGGLNLEMERETTDRQKIDYGEETSQILKQGVKKLFKMIEQADKDKDIVLLNCLNEKLAAVKGLLKVVEDANLGVQEAVARKNSEQVEHEFRKVLIARNQGKQFIVESDACIGDVGTSYPGQTRIQWDYEGDDRGIEDIEDLFPPLDFEDTVRPPPVTPYQ